MPPNSYYRPLPWTSIFLDPTTRLEVLEGAPSFAPFSEGWALTIKRRDLLLCSFFVTSLFPDFFTSPLPPPQSPPTPSNTPPPTPTAPAHTPPTPHPESPAHSSSHPQNSKPRTHTPDRRPTILRTPTISASSYAPALPTPPQNNQTQTQPSAPVLWKRGAVAELRSYSISLEPPGILARPLGKFLRRSSRNAPIHLK